MSNDFPGFLEDKPQPKKKPDVGAQAGGFNPFADVEVQSSPLGITQPGSGVPVPAKPTAAAAPPAGFNAFAGADTAPASAANEAEIKPGQGKDLWACPHCGAKNKPDRSTCRECGKKPTDEVIIPFMKTPAGRFGVPAGVVLAVVILGWLMFGGSVKLVPAGAGHIDSAVRRGGAVGPEETINGLVFQPKNLIAVSGRVIAVGNTSGLTTIVLALGKDAKDDEAIASVGVDFGAQPPLIQPELRTVILYVFGNVPEISKGSYLSVLGDGGRLIRDGVYATDFNHGEVIRIKQSSP